MSFRGMLIKNGIVLGQSGGSIIFPANIVLENGRILLIDGNAVNVTKGARQGALGITLDRQSTAPMTGWDGNPDCGLKIQVNNRATNTTARGAVRALDIQARNRGTCVWVKAMELNARNDSGKNCVNLEGLHIRLENYGQVDDDIVGFHIEMSSENDTSSPSKTAILVRNTDQSGMTAVDSVLKVSHTSANGFTNLLELATASGDCAEAYNAAGTGAYSIKCKINNVTTYIHTYDAP